MSSGPGLIDVHSPFDSFGREPSYSPKMNRHQNQQQQPRNMSRGDRDRQNQGRC